MKTQHHPYSYISSRKGILENSKKKEKKKKRNEI
jgi:hypothetical protein